MHDISFSHMKECEICPNDKRCQVPLELKNVQSCLPGLDDNKGPIGMTAPLSNTIVFDIQPNEHLMPCIGPLNFSQAEMS